MYCSLPWIVRKLLDTLESDHGHHTLVSWGDKSELLVNVVFLDLASDHCIGL